MSHLQFPAIIGGQAGSQSACYSPSAMRIDLWQSIRLWSSPLFAQQHRAFLPYTFFASRTLMTYLRTFFPFENRTCSILLRNSELLGIEYSITAAGLVCDRWSSSPLLILTPLAWSFSGIYSLFSKLL